MRALPGYLREHPWQRRLLTAGLALAAGLLAAVLGYPTVRDHLVLRRLGSDDPAVRARAVRRATALAAESPRMLRRLEHVLQSKDDETFLAAAEVLRNLGRFHTPDRSGWAVDRWRALQLAEPLPANYAPADVESRALLLMRVIADGRDNAYVRRALADAAESPAPALRRLAATLAGRLADPATLDRLLADEADAVAADAALAAGCASFPEDARFQDPTTSEYELASALLGTLARGDGVERASAAAYALSKLPTPSSHAGDAVADRLRETDDPLLRDRLCHVVGAAGESWGDTAAMDIFRRSRRNGDFPPAAAMLAAARLELAEAAPAARDVLSAAAEGSDELTEPQVLAAMELARSLNLPLREELDAYCRRHWRPGLSVSMAEAARLLAEQMANDPDGDAALRERNVETLRRAALYGAYAKIAAMTRPVEAWDTPRASAAAAAALWTLDQAAAEPYVREAAGDEDPLSGDTIAWRLSRADPDAGFLLALRMLPAPGVPPGERVYDADERATGAMLLALSARTADRKQQARQRLRERLDSIPEPFLVRGSLRCGLAALGDEESRRVLGELLASGVFPRRRALTALLAAGDMSALDWLLWNPSVSDRGALKLLIDDGLSDVLAETAPDLPRVDGAADPDLRRWQLRILRQYYAVRKGSLRLRPQP
jgi:hypothetical protein